MNTHLSTLEERPGADVVIYDGNCQFCRNQVQRLARLDTGQRLAFVSLHEPVVAERFPELSHEQLMEQMYVVDSRGAPHGGAAAIRYLSRRLPRIWILAPLLHIPGTMPLWQWGYRQFALRRYRFNGLPDEAECRNGACRVHLANRQPESQSGEQD